MPPGLSRDRAAAAAAGAVVPSAPRGLQLTVSQDDPPVIVATWSAPRRSYGDIVSYKLTYGIRGDNYVEERRFEGEKYRFTTGFLGEYTALRCVTVTMPLLW